MTNDIASLDSNFKVSPGGVNLKWYDGQNFHIDGKGWELDKPHYKRLPIKAEKNVTPEVWRLGQYSAGVSIYFETNSTSLSIHWKLKSILAMSGMSLTGANGCDLYKKENGKWRYASVCSYKDLDSNVEVMAFLDKGKKIYCLYLPLFAETEFVRIGIDEDSKIEPHIPFQGNPILFYGTSIVHGTAVSRPGMTYPSQIGRALQKSTLNLAFSGNARMEIEVARLLAEQDPCLFVIDPLPNMDLQGVEERAYPFFKHLIQQRPLTPILMVGCIPYCSKPYLRSNTKRHVETNPAFKKVFERLKAEGHLQVNYFDASNMLGDDFEGTIDGTHPNDLGFYRIAESLKPIIKKICDLKLE